MKKTGILLHISSLPGKYGIGTFGKEAYRFVDFLNRSGQSYWQILPLTPTSYGDSPYQSPSIYAGNLYFIDPELISGKTNNKQVMINNGYVDYGKLFYNKNKYLHSIKVIKSDDYYGFCDKNREWLFDYALYSILKKKFNYKPWYEWDTIYRNRNYKALEKFYLLYKEEIELEQYLQYLFFQQYHELKSYANKSGIQIIGDMPIYVSLDSVEVWANPHLFKLDDNKMPIEVAGVPPDYFSKKGQLWGNPLYDWDYMRSDDYKWWRKRMENALSLYDIVRIDHFRGFSQYYAIPYGRRDATIGTWKMGPGERLFNHINKDFGNERIIAEDLGTYDSLLQSLLDRTNYPGMKVLQFELININPKKRLDIIKTNSIVYTGTHDNETIVGWYYNLPLAIKRLFKEKLLIDQKYINWSFIELAYQTKAKLTIIPMQDILGLTNNYRVNIPSTITGNWRYRLMENQLTENLAERLLYHTIKNNRK